MNDTTPRRGAELNPADETTARRISATPSNTTRAPSSKHFKRLEECMKEAMDDGDTFSRRQAQGLLEGMMEMLNGPHVNL